MTEFEKVMKYTLLAPLKDKDKSAHKLGSLNEENVRGVIGAVLKGVGWDLVDIFECGFLCNKEEKWLGTSLDGWLLVKKPLVSKEPPTGETTSNPTNVETDNDESNNPISCGLEIKNPSGKKLLNAVIRPIEDQFGAFSACEFGDAQFKR